jgi:hypothetical protein
MGQKLCAGSSDTPLVTLNCNFVNVNRSPNTNIDFIDGEEEEEKQQQDNENPRLQCCCLSWRRPKKENATKRATKNNMTSATNKFTK